MIKSNLPLPFLYRLQLRGRAFSTMSNDGSSLAGGEARDGKRPVRPGAHRRDAGPATEQFVSRFVDEYERFTGVLCEAARNGCGDKCEQEYVRARRWFIGHYYRIAPRLRPYLAQLGGPDKRKVVDYAGQSRSLDAVEELFLPRTLQDLLSEDGGELIPRIAAVSDAVYRCVAEWENPKGEAV